MDPARFLALMADEFSERVPERERFPNRETLMRAAEVWSSGALEGYLFAQGWSWLQFQGTDARFAGKPRDFARAILERGR